MILVAALVLGLIFRSIALSSIFWILATLTWRYWSARLVIDDLRLGEITLYCPKAEGNKVWLTFDDGPGPETLALVEELNRRGHRATFFFLGEQIERYPDLETLRLALAEGGHSVANHTYSHPNLLHLDERQLELELHRTEELLELHFEGLKCPLFRPPFGYRDKNVLALAERLGLRVIGWSVNSLDFLSGSPDRIVERVVSRTKAGSILLFHDGRERRDRTLKALPSLLDRLEQRNYGAYSPR